MAKDLKYADPASQQMKKKAETDNIDVVWDRYEKMHPACGFGQLGICCRNCSMGPCRIDPFGDGPQAGICGADADTIAARNIARMIASGVSAHSDHGREIAHTLQMISEGKNCDYSIKDENKLKAIAEVYKIDSKNKNIMDICQELAKKTLEEFGRPEGELIISTLAPDKRLALWRNLGLIPRAIDREVVELMHRSHMGVDTDYRNIIKQGMRTALADGWGGSLIASELSDIIFGSPTPIRSAANLGVLQKDCVNILVHGHEPTLSDIIAITSQDKELIKKAENNGAKGINIAGICCTANEILMRHGIPIAGNFLQQELAVLTGAVDLMVVDVQCLMPALHKITNCFHTKLVTTSAKAKIPGVEHIGFNEQQAVDIAKQIIGNAIDNYLNRNSANLKIPEHTEKLVAGFTPETIYTILGGKYRSTYRPLNDAVISGRIRGAAGVIGCSNPNMEYEEAHIKIVKELIKNDTIVVTTGCNAISCAKHGLMQPESAFQFAGKGLQEVCEAVGLPPILHLGSCVDNSRILITLANIISEGGLGEDLSDLPVAGAAPEWMSEKAVAIGFYFVASGVYTLTCQPLPVMGSKNLTEYLTKDIEKEVGGKWAFEIDPVKAAHKMLSHIDKKRKKLKLKEMIYEQEFISQTDK